MGAARNHTVHPSAAETTTFQTAGFEVEGPELLLAIDVTATGGTPTLDITVEWSPDGNNWGAAQAPDALPQITATGVTVEEFVSKARYARLNCAIAGTSPSLTFVAVATMFPRVTR